MSKRALVRFFAVVVPTLLFAGQVGSEPAALADVDEAAHIQKPVGGTWVWPTRAPPPDVGARFFRNEDVLTQLPRAPAWAHENVQGVFWLDQRGTYGSSTLEDVFNDLVFTYGSADASFDNATLTWTMYTAGQSWTWFNAAGGYESMSFCQKARCGYNFTWNRDHSFCSIRPFVAAYGVENPMAETLISYTMTVLRHAPGACPPQRDAPQGERDACAFARRDTLWLLKDPPFVKQIHYYVYRIGDANHTPVQPYFDAYLAFANTTSAPDPLIFKYYFGGSLPVSARQSDVQMVSTKPMA